MSTLRVVVPASTSNLGPGFDCVGLAVDRHLTLDWDAHGDGSLESTGARPPAGFGDLLDTSLERLGLPSTGRLRIHSEIPVGRGLGSSAALRTGLAVLRRHLRDHVVDRGSVLEEVTLEEGHPDNAAPALFGGLVVATGGGDRIRVTSMPLSEEIGWAFAAPSTPASTDVMRAALPSKLPHAVAARAVGRVAVLLPALAAGDGEALAWAMRDELHVPYRLDRIPGGARVVAAALRAGAWGCTLSGAGSGLIAAARPTIVADVVAAMDEAFRAVDPDPSSVLALTLQPEREGAHWTEGVSPG